MEDSFLLFLTIFELLFFTSYVMGDFPAMRAIYHIKMKPLYRCMLSNNYLDYLVLFFLLFLFIDTHISYYRQSRKKETSRSAVKNDLHGLSLL